LRPLLPQLLLVVVLLLEVMLQHPWQHQQQLRALHLQQQVAALA
jgi:hypothetical protein